MSELKTRGSGTYGNSDLAPALDENTVEMRQYVPEDGTAKTVWGAVCLVVASVLLVCEWLLNHLPTQFVLSAVFDTEHAPADVVTTGAILMTIVYGILVMMGFGLIIAGSNPGTVPKR